MICRTCGKEINDGARYCPICGMETAAPTFNTDLPLKPKSSIKPATAGPVMASPTSAKLIFADERKNKSNPSSVKAPAAAGGAAVNMASPVTEKHNRKTYRLWVISAILLLIIAIIPAIILSNKNQRYTEAMSLVEIGSFVEAQNIFLQLGTYNSSDQMVEICKNGLSYQNALELKASGAYESAIAIFSTLNYKDSLDQASECANALDYNKAVTLIESGNYVEAQEILKDLGNYLDSAALLKQCDGAIQYAKAESLMAIKDYAAAKQIFSELAAAGNTQAGEQEIICDYELAKEAMANGNFYTAYKSFVALKDYSDAPELAAKCVQIPPKDGELYRNENYLGDDSRIRISTANDGNYNLIRVYTEENVPVASLFLQPNMLGTIKLPAGSYIIKYAYGERWFGETDLFGTEGSYKILSFGDNNVSVVNFIQGYTYTLILKTAKDGDVGMQAIAFRDF